MKSSYKFVQKLWIMYNEIINKIATNKDDIENKEFDNFTMKQLQILQTIWRNLIIM